ncbi:uncharacterized protein LOC125710203 isoform X40 [Brienomyrus brachyistius]|uniref:uncharacterized protein LOC125710203 isoform X40 n=1 Tax=Brienomyrus brachyistius TaxID=42636 RepID=UPI0020B249B5|nr:uncharacterized protein LOC125710203 isoform X40 [Brienomyrus brachyistius]XP_048835665.1 uncharacterized protein LOC125710203 isoform X40 [Brienomyrus brachyistius]XP_048835666.1 uncharacterized protein LOC125710203 isoform X40 [Brienomyrus brachyistius]
MLGRLFLGWTLGPPLQPWYLHRKIHNRKQNASCGSTLQAQNAPDSCQDQVGLLDGALVRRSQSRSFSMQITLPDGSSVKKRQGRFKDGSKVKRRHTLLPSPTQNTTSDIPDNESSQDFPVQERPKRRHTIGPSLTQNTNFEGEKILNALFYGSNESRDHVNDKTQKL